MPRDESGNMLPKPFWAGLEELFPLPPGWKATKRRDEQLKRFTTHFLISIVRDEHPKVVAAEEERKRLERKRLKRLIERKAEQYVSKGKRIKPLSEEEKRRLLSEEEQEEIRIEAGNRLKEMQRTGIHPSCFGQPPSGCDPCLTSMSPRYALRRELIFSQPKRRIDSQYNKPEGRLASGRVTACFNFRAGRCQNHREWHQAKS